MAETTAASSKKVAVGFMVTGLCIAFLGRQIIEEEAAAFVPCRRFYFILLGEMDVLATYFFMSRPLFS